MVHFLFDLRQTASGSSGAETKSTSIQTIVFGDIGNRVSAFDEDEEDEEDGEVVQEDEQEERDDEEKQPHDPENEAVKSPSCINNGASPSSTYISCAPLQSRENDHRRFTHTAAPSHPNQWPANSRTAKNVRFSLPQ